MSVKVKTKKKALSESHRDHALGGADTSVFSSRDEMTSPERDAVKVGENRGKRVVMSERPEHYGCIAEEDTRQYRKNLALVYGDCKKCEAFVKGTDKPGEHCSLSKIENCLE